MTGDSDCLSYERLVEMIESFPPPPKPIRLTRRQMDALPKATPKPERYGVLSADLFGIPVHRVDRVEDSTPYQLEHPGEPASIDERHAEIRRAAAATLLGDDGQRLLEEDAVLAMTFKQATGMLASAEDAMCELDIPPDVRTAVLSGMLLGPAAAEYSGLSIVAAAAARALARRKAIDQLTRTAFRVAPMGLSALVSVSAP
ncbi:hypothetical protein [Amycolatopsis kentuckyensis]|uniref:hypothetical protein n=1 Tax=Amycolatopsis kentuckyensis TaxID=218823 RepID=UPI00356250AD